MNKLLLTYNNKQSTNEIMFGKTQQTGGNPPPSGLARGLGGLIDQNKLKQGNPPPNNKKPQPNYPVQPQSNQYQQQNSYNPMNDLGGALGRTLKPNPNDPSTM